MSREYTPHPVYWVAWVGQRSRYSQGNVSDDWLSLSNCSKDATRASSMRVRATVADTRRLQPVNSRERTVALDPVAASCASTSSSTTTGLLPPRPHTACHGVRNDTLFTGHGSTCATVVEIRVLPDMRITGGVELLPIHVGMTSPPSLPIWGQSRVRSILSTESTTMATTNRRTVGGRHKQSSTPIEDLKAIEASAIIEPSCPMLTLLAFERWARRANTSSAN